MVFAAGLGQRMRPITETLPEAAGQGARARRSSTIASTGSPRTASRRLSSTSIGSPTGSRRISRDRTQPRIVISDERGKILDQGGGIKRALPLIGKAPFLVCNTDAFWIEGPRSNIARLAEAFDPEAMDIALLVAASAGAVGVDWPGDFTMTREGRLEAREDRHVAPFVYTGVGILKPGTVRRRDGRRLPPRPVTSTPPPPGVGCYGVRLDGLWLHVGRPETIAEAEEAIERSIL